MNLEALVVLPDRSPPPPLGGLRKAQPWGFWMTTALGLAVILISLFIGIIPAVVTTNGSLPLDGCAYSITVSVTAFVVVGLSWLFARLKREIQVRDYLAVAPVSVKALAWSLLLAAVLGFTYGWLSMGQGTARFPEALVERYQNAGFLPLLWVGVVVASPISEEVFFRGFLFAGFQKSFLGSVGATVVTSSVWACAHLQYDAYTLFALFAFGLLLGAVRDITGSIVPTVLMHMLINLIVLIQLAYWVG